MKNKTVVAESSKQGEAKAVNEKHHAIEKSKVNKKKIFLILLAVVVLAGASLFQIVADTVRQAADELLLAQVNKAITGQVVVGSLDVSVLGTVKATEVKVLDASGRQLVKSEEIRISYRWRDLLKRQLGLQAVSVITIDKPEIWIVYEQDRLNWKGLLVDTAGEPSRFGGVVDIQEGKVHVETALVTKTADRFAGRIDYTQADQLRFSGSGLVDQTAVKVVGQWGATGPSSISLTAQGMDLVKLGLTTGADPIQVTAGSLDEVIVKVGQDPAGLAVLETLAGRFSGVATTGELVIAQGSGSFEKQGAAIIVSDGQALYKGQAVTATGQVLTEAEGKQVMDFTVHMPSADPAAVLPNLKGGGLLSVKATITGPVLAPVVTGDFTVGSLLVGDMTVSGIRGTFSYDRQTMQLLSATGTTTGGVVRAGGVIYPTSERYELTVSGNGLDSSQLTPKEVTGPLSFSGGATGDALAAAAEGTFAIDNGKAYGIAFRRLTGNFVKQGSAETQVSNLVVETSLGTFYPEELSRDVMEKLRERQLPVTKEEIKEAVKDALKDELLKRLMR